jgi:hypothetical protein
VHPKASVQGAPAAAGASHKSVELQMSPKTQSESRAHGAPLGPSAVHVLSEAAQVEWMTHWLLAPSGSHACPRETDGRHVPQGENEELALHEPLAH